MTNLFEKIKYHKEQNLPFVIYSKPNSDKTTGLFQKNNELYNLDDFKAKGFVFVPFDEGFTCLIPKIFSEVIIEVNNFENVDSGIISSLSKDDDFTQKQQFEKLVENAIENINLGLTEKIVVSRKEIVAIDSFDIELAFKKMLSAYKSAFKYCFFHPKVGMWMGATPEQFLKIENNTLNTVALAGTRLISEDAWGEKEIKEQQYVTDFIVSNIAEYVNEVNVSKPYTVTAGNIQHIKTDIEARLNSANDLEGIINKMHPTPAVCGLQKDAAKDFILKNENYNRKYYAGFLGELNFCNESNSSLVSDLFVNLRCMEVKDTTAEIYIGCGITRESNPENEYIETKNKSETMRNILNK